MKPYSFLIASAFLAAICATAIVAHTMPQSVGDWANLLSAIVSILALGALITTLALQREELQLQRAEIARLANTSQEQTLHSRRQSLVESYRGIDEKIDTVFHSEDFETAIRRSSNPTVMKYSSREMREFDGQLHSANIVGLPFLNTYKFITEDHVVPITFFDVDEYNGQGDLHYGLMKMSRYIMMSGIPQAARLAKHIYSMAEELDLLEYARARMQRICELEPLINIVANFVPISVDGDTCRVSPNFAGEPATKILEFHVASAQKFYSLQAARIANYAVARDVPPHYLQAPVTQEILLEYPIGDLQELDDDVPF